MNKEELIQKLVDARLGCMSWKDLARYFWIAEFQYYKDNYTLEDLIKEAKELEIEDFEIEP